MQHEDVKPPVPLAMLVMDVDGTLTDGGMYYSESGDEFKRFNTKDGMLLGRLSRRGFQLAFLSGGLSKRIAQRRAEMLGVQRCHVGPGDKTVILDEWRMELKLDWEQIGYIGDDINDAKVMKQVGFAACPADAHPSIKEIAHVTLQRKGGDACVREFIDRFIEAEHYS